MANTGTKIVLTLKEGTEPCPPCTPFTGNTKPNVVEDPDYIAPYFDSVDCNVLAGLDCPVPVAATGFTDGTVQYEFFVTSSTLAVPSLAKIKIKFMLIGVEEASFTYTLPNATPNYFEGSVSGLTASTTYDIEIDYLDSGDVVIVPDGNCVTGITVTTSETP